MKASSLYSTVCRPVFNRTPLGYGGTRDWHYGCLTHKSTAVVWWYHVSMEQKHLVEPIMKLKVRPIQYFCGVPNKVAGLCIPSFSISSWQTAGELIWPRFAWWSGYQQLVLTCFFVFFKASWKIYRSQGLITLIKICCVQNLYHKPLQRPRLTISPHLLHQKPIPPYHC